MSREIGVALSSRPLEGRRDFPCRFVQEVAAEKGISIAKLARKADLDYKTVYRVAKDTHAEISTVTLGRLAEALGVSVKDVVEDAPDEK